MNRMAQSAKFLSPRAIAAFPNIATVTSTIPNPGNHGDLCTHGARDAGASIIGGCCGTAGEHLAAMRSALDSQPRGPMPDVEAVEAALGTITTPTDAAENHKRDREGRRRRRQD
ncbi:MAG: homocysteine S-methyltransferase family protein [Geminicoccaceae bacterium]